MKLQWNVLVKIAQVHYMVAVRLVLRHIKLRKLRASHFLKLKTPFWVKMRILNDFWSR